MAGGIYIGMCWEAWVKITGMLRSTRLKAEHLGRGLGFGESSAFQKLPLAPSHTSIYPEQGAGNP